MKIGDYVVAVLFRRQDIGDHGHHYILRGLNLVDGMVISFDEESVVLRVPGFLSCCLEMVPRAAVFRHRQDVEDRILGKTTPSTGATVK